MSGMNAAYSPPVETPKTKTVLQRNIFTGKEEKVVVEDTPDPSTPAELTDEQIAALPPPWNRTAKGGYSGGWRDSKGNPVKDGNDYVEGGRYRKAKKGDIPLTLLQSMGIPREALG